MLQSDYCVLPAIGQDESHQVNECEYDQVRSSRFLPEEARV